MNKDAFLATVIGFMLGLAITSLILFAPGTLKSLSGVKINLSWLAFLNSAKSTPPAIPKNNETAETKEPLTVDAPLPDTITDNAVLLVSGSALPGSVVIIAGPVDETVSRTGSDGKYAGKITVNEGKNNLLISSYLDQKVTVKNLDIFYTVDKLQ
jgi:hypothetical protein